MGEGVLPRIRTLRAGARCIDYMLSGERGPTIILFSGAGVTLEGWAPLYPAIERIARVLAWNRPGAGRSSRSGRLLDSQAVLHDLRLLLDTLQLQPPFVLVGHSLGGLHAQLFARKHPREVAGMVLVESLHAGDSGNVRGHHKRLVGALSRQLGVTPREIAVNVRDETAAATASAAQVEAAPSLPLVPLAVVTGAKPPPGWLVPGDALRRKRVHQKELAASSRRGVHVVARRSGHFPQLTQPRLVLDAIRSVAGQARTAARSAAPA